MQQTSLDSVRLGANRPAFTAGLALLLAACGSASSQPSTNGDSDGAAPTAPSVEATSSATTGTPSDAGAKPTDSSPTPSQSSGAGTAGTQPPADAAASSQDPAETSATPSSSPSTPATQSAAPSSSSTSPPPVTTDEITFDIALAGLLDGDSTDWEQGRDVAFDETGALYVVGGTSSPNFPVTQGAYDTTFDSGGSALGSRGPLDGFVTKIDVDGNIVWSTYLGGPNYERVYAVEVDENHDVYLAGRAGPGFPTTSGVLQPAFAGDTNGAGSAYGSQDGFVAKLSADGSTLLWATYFGDSGPGFIRDLDVDAQHRVHIAATAMMGTELDSYVTSNAAQATRSGDSDEFYARISADGTTVEYGTYLGGNDSGGSYSGNPAVRVLDDGTAFVLTNSPGDGAPTTPNAYQPHPGGGFDFIVAKFEPSGTLSYCTYLGGSADELMDTHSLAVTAQGNAVVGGASLSADYPVTDDSVWVNKRDFVVTVLSADGSDLVASTLFGGDGQDGLEGISIDAAGNIYVTGYTQSADLPVTSGAIVKQRGATPNGEGILGVFSADLSTLRYLSYDGLPGEYINRSSMVTPGGTWAIVGSVWQLPSFPATAGQDSVINGTHGAFFLQLKPE